MECGFENRTALSGRCGELQHPLHSTIAVSLLHLQQQIDLRRTDTITAGFTPHEKRLGTLRFELFGGRRMGGLAGGTIRLWRLQYCRARRFHNARAGRLLDALAWWASL
jgi:hypothetical protein